MAKGKIDLREELKYYKFEFDLLQKIPCSKQENKEYQNILKNGDSLPDGVYQYKYEGGELSTTEFYTIYEPNLTADEIQEYLTYQQLTLISTIKSCVVFFTVLTVIGMIAYLLILMGAFN